jgi:UDP-3-O-[3-hydroxymyristoyl] glucosamine N-acyltransferase
MAKKSSASKKKSSGKKTRSRKTASRVTVPKNMAGKQLVIVESPSKARTINKYLGGDYVVMAGQVGIRDHVDIGNQVILGAKAGVMNSVADGETYAGIPATPWQDQRHKQAAWTKLPEMRKEIRELTARLAELERRIGER